MAGNEVMKKPSKAQLKVLKAMRDGQTLVYATWVTGSHWGITHPQGFNSYVNRKTVSALRDGGWIQAAGAPKQINISTRRQEWALTDAGRAALRKALSPSVPEVK
jgi:hypothetical protein